MAGLAGISAGIGRNAGVFGGVSASFRRFSVSVFAGGFSGFFSVSSSDKSQFTNAKPKPIIIKTGTGDPLTGNF
jgi:hypothetical protein